MSTAPKLDDTTLLDGLEKLLLSRNEIHEFWWDPDAEVMCVGDQAGDTLREALTNLVLQEK